ncbi:MAG: alpha/beta fold hydrolase [Gaiellaceae bacterium]
MRLFLPGWGASPELWAPFAQAGDLLGGEIEPGLDVVGWSLGAMLALDAATRIELGSLTLIGASPQFVRSEGYRHGWRDSVLARMRERLGSEPDAVVDEFLPLMFAPGEEVVSPPRERDPAILDAGLRFLEHYSLLGRAGSIACPVRLLHGGRDALCPLAAAELLAATLPRAELTVLPQAGHALPLSHPDEVSEWLRR